MIGLIRDRTGKQGIRGTGSLNREQGVRGTGKLNREQGVRGTGRLRRELRRETGEVCLGFFFGANEGALPKV